VAALLRPLAEAHLAVLWSPYPALNGTGNWWSGHPGPEGSEELYLRLYERLTGQVNLHNLAWVWEAVPPSFNPGGNNAPGGNGALEDYFPGPLYIDAITLDADTLAGRRFPLDRLVTQFAGGKPFGVRVASGVPGTGDLAREVNWRWMLLSPAAVSGPAGVSGSDAIKAFYADPHVLAAPQK
jgi:hypothetical protein